MPTFAPHFRSRSSNKRETNILAVMRFEKLFERDEFLFDPFSTFRVTTFERVRMRILVSSRHTTCESVVQKRLDLLSK